MRRNKQGLLRRDAYLRLQYLRLKPCKAFLQTGDANMRLYITFKHINTENNLIN